MKRDETYSKKCIKTFEVRNSLLTDAMEDQNMRSSYGMFASSFIMYMTYNLLEDHYFHGNVFRGWYSLMTAFEKFHFTILIWIGMYTLGCFAYVGFKFWANLRQKLMPKSKSLDIICISALGIYYVSSFKMARVLSLWLKLPMLSRLIVIFEQIRILMKVHSFIRYNVPKVLTFKVHDDKVLILPSVSQFVYFTFAPTLIYRGNYPRLKKIRWKFLLICLLETVCCFFFSVTMHARAVTPLFQEYGERRFHISELVLAGFKAVIPTTLGLLILNYMFLHTTQNFFGELLKFGDRQFYRSWWTCSTLFEFFRNWNVIVYDWLFAYIYRDIVDLIGQERKLAAKLVLFLASGMVHEVIMTYTMNIFFPVMSAELLICGILSALPSTRFGNILFWCMIYSGSSLLYSSYIIEYWARQNVPSEEDRWIDFLIPRSLTCDCLQ